MLDFYILYNFSNGKLYFGSGIRKNNTSGEWVVCYDTLYPDETGSYWKPLNEFFAEIQRGLKPAGFERVPRFTLVQELPVEKIQMLLPGTKVLRATTGQIEEFTVSEVFQGGSDVVYVELSERESTISTNIPLQQFLDEFIRPNQ